MIRVQATGTCQSISACVEMVPLLSFFFFAAAVVEMRNCFTFFSLAAATLDRLPFRWPRNGSIRVDKPFKLKLIIHFLLLSRFHVSNFRGKRREMK